MISNFKLFPNVNISQNFVQNVQKQKNTFVLSWFWIRNFFELKLWITNFFELKLWITNFFELKLWFRNLFDLSLWIMALFDLSLWIVALFELALKHEIIGSDKKFDLSGTSD